MSESNPHWEWNRLNERDQAILKQKALHEMGLVKIEDTKHLIAQITVFIDKLQTLKQTLSGEYIPP